MSMAALVTPWMSTENYLPGGFNFTHSCHIMGTWNIMNRTVSRFKNDAAGVTEYAFLRNL